MQGRFTFLVPAVNLRSGSKKECDDSAFVGPGGDMQRRPTPIVGRTHVSTAPEEYFDQLCVAPKHSLMQSSAAPGAPGMNVSSVPQKGLGSPRTTQPRCNVQRGLASGYRSCVYVRARGQQVLHALHVPRRCCPMQLAQPMLVSRVDASDLRVSHRCLCAAHTHTCLSSGMHAQN